MSTEIRNARITSTMLGYEDHGIFTFMLGLDYGGSKQGFGGYFLAAKDGWGIGGLVMILRTVGVESWEQVKGQYVRAKIVDGLVHEIGHPLKDVWTRFREIPNDDEKGGTAG